MSTYTVKLGSGHYNYSGSEIQLTFSKALESVGLEKRIPEDMKSAVKDYLRDLFSDINDLSTEIIVKVPDYLSEYGDIIAEIIRNSLG
ncbi:hypothetical protein [Bowmanella yangjiangensis]|uniref:Uncharacterized protein n=1 Tax=Bowmanella yangjiangensis TaxID=2811230 RepID=A0ABS3CRS7_9ALTE|nr:hypothetical protein [Bowmanella yangjiangensis]MBN7819224.1 hypothetical protein [Bowmanella yangjiangensis]